ncbi:hypothetical protein B0S90_1089 [Caldicellulosiruptor bescii]|uniref:Uncharacterized protein n=1 Tax=Caldicellulosiruptor bescii TaxID=31899 RepID=A0ABY1SB44_CALBS|nr:hypothetical protein B0S87_0217 [Caldicellulosiruptor bescii]PBC90260.1 hypothetical protein B0S89_0591 [Caldicellulosiruptor bescii]PBD04312.1 hypothetical protein B0S85_1958 [Caldicellulosiruptor bescii]PBD06057.1 hypothetical protein B0S90_1089 [Caldicellulosiruptor bescii]PBD08943.1 hypothetical protein B0S84_1313 [Caldicellulosiruptor bescii]
MLFTILVIYLCLPKIFLIEIKVEKAIFVGVKFNFLGIYVCIFYKKIPVSGCKKVKHFSIGKGAKKKKSKLFSTKTVFRLIRIFLLSTVVKVVKICARIYCADAFILSILSASIYSIWGILMSCGQNTKLDYQAFCQENFLSSTLQLNISIKIFPIKLLTNTIKAINKQKGGVKLGTSN